MEQIVRYRQVREQRSRSWGMLLGGAIGGVLLWSAGATLWDEWHGMPTAEPPVAVQEPLPDQHAMIRGLERSLADVRQLRADAQALDTEIKRRIP
jgi:type II secretory pathway component PulM